MEPWHVERCTIARVNEIIYLMSESLRIAGILLQPFIPEKAANLLHLLGVCQDKRQLHNATFRSDLSYGTAVMDKVTILGGVLFPPRDWSGLAPEGTAIGDQESA